MYSTVVLAYPAHWWNKVPENQRQGDWEILPQSAAKGEVILSKRNELGIFSNFGHAPFELEGKTYASIEGLWQMMKYPDLTDTSDPRLKYFKDYPFTREEVSLMHGFEAKKAGDLANIVNKKNGFNFVSYKKKFFNYKDMALGTKTHYEIIKNGTKNKILQNPKVAYLLKTTKGLKLRPDHIQGEDLPPSYAYFDILMNIRNSL